MRSRPHARPAKTDPALLRQLRTGAARDEPVSAVFRLRPHSEAELALPPGETQSATRTVLERVSGTVGERPERFNVFENFGAFAVLAKPAFLRELMAQPEIAAVMANRQEDALIRPVERKRVAARKRVKRRR